MIFKLYYDLIQTMKIVADISPCPYPNPNDTVYNANVPYWGLISGGLKAGKIIEIRGFVLLGANCIHINLVNGQDYSLNRLADRLLHISIRFENRIIVLNTFTDNKWGCEKRDENFPFEIGCHFTLMILVEIEGFYIAVNGKHQWHFPHRMPFSMANMLHIDGNVKLEEIHFMNTPNCSVPSMKNEKTLSYRLEPVLNPRVPYYFPIQEGLRPGTMIYISGRPTVTARKLTINLLCNIPPPPEDIAFHFDIRMYNSTVVRNTCIKGKWCREEIRCPSFPFQRGVFFDMIIRVDDDKYMVALNGQHFIEYYHRVFPLNKINMITIENDAVLTSIRVAN